MKKALTFALIIASATLLFSCKGGNKSNETVEEEQTTEQNMKTLFDPAQLSEEPVFQINTSMGTITVKLYSDTPKHRDNFVKLASERFFDGILFHRVIDGFMIQTGDPLTKDMANKTQFGTGGPGYEIPAEFVPAHNHKLGALAAARKGDRANPMKNSSGSQFYIVQNPQTCQQLDGQYTVFGETLDGFDVIEKIAKTQVDERDCPVSPVKIISVIPVIEQKEAASDSTATE